MPIAGVIAETGPSALRALLERLEPSLVERVEWDARPRDFRRSMNEAVGRAASDSEIDYVLKGVDTLRSEAGMRALRSVVAVDADLLAQFDAQPDRCSRAIFVFLNKPNDFANALDATFADGKLGRRSADGYRLDGEINDEIEINDLLTLRLSAALKAVRIEVPADSGIGVEVFRRRPRDVPTGTEREILHLSVFFEQASDAYVGVTKAGRTRRSVRRQDPVRAAALIDLTDRTIDVFVLGGREVRDQLANAVVETLFPSAKRGIRLERNPVQLQMLKRRSVLDVRSTDPIERAMVVSIVVRPDDGAGGLIMLKRRDDKEFSDVYQASEAWFEDFDPIVRESWRIVSVDIRFFFKPAADGKSPRARTVTLTLPNRSTLYALPENERRAIVELLQRWGIMEPAASACEVLDLE